MYNINKQELPGGNVGRRLNSPPRRERIRDITQKKRQTTHLVFSVFDSIKTAASALELTKNTGTFSHDDTWFCPISFRNPFAPLLVLFYFYFIFIFEWESRTFEIANLFFFCLFFYCLIDVGSLLFGCCWKNVLWAWALWRHSDQAVFYFFKNSPAADD